MGVVAALLYLEFAVGANFIIHLPPPPEPRFLKPRIIIQYPHKTYEKDIWWNTWDETLV
jgi:hypothetical protein